MVSRSISNPIGVVGAGSFGTVVANLLAENCENIWLFVKDKSRSEKVAATRVSAHQQLSDRIKVTHNIQIIGEECEVIFPIVPSANFRDMMITLSPYLKPYHILIHGTKGFDIVKSKKREINKNNIKTMSEVIKEESAVVRIGCMSGPNLAKEIAKYKPAATIIASPFNEVIETGRKLLKNDRFIVYGGNDIIGAELCGILKNIIAVGAGLLNGLNMGENAKALLISRGLIEMIEVGTALGGNTNVFLGLAGVGDLIATCSSEQSRNHHVGYMLAQGKNIHDIIEEMEEVAEGVKTIETIYKLSKIYNFKCVINELLYKIIYQNFSVSDAQNVLMKLPFKNDFDYF